MSHTPGPWDIGYIIEGGFQIHGTAEGDKFVITTRNPISLKMQDESASNARLIAAAPDYWDAVENLTTDASELDGDNAGYVAVPKHAFDALLAAIAKAEGR